MTLWAILAAREALVPCLHVTLAALTKYAQPVASLARRQNRTRCFTGTNLKMNHDVGRSETQ